MNKLSQVAAMVRKAGASGSRDTILAHITPQEAAMLKARGGSGEIDPDTGLPHFDDGGDSSDSSESQQSAPQYAGFGGETPVTTDPTYNAKGYYSAAGDYAGGNDEDANPTRYYAYRQTIGGNIADALGYDPEGWGAKLINGGINAVGAVNPMVGLVGKIAQAGVASGSTQSPADMDGNGGSMNMLGRLAAGNNPKLAALASIPVFQASQAPQSAQPQIAQSSQGSQPRTRSVNDIYADMLKRRRKQA